MSIRLMKRPPWRFSQWGYRDGEARANSPSKGESATGDDDIDDHVHDDNVDHVSDNDYDMQSIINWVTKQ